MPRGDFKPGHFGRAFFVPSRRIERRPVEPRI